ncbi:UDP-glucosyltransferase 2-like isoform X4 [Adelges cooleyi]|uniref:UDP-glucosyltransferase 2-like isoform X4 n=1 Tax=Adelges cooleyi TaxID=133065 RepID=UPI00217F7721|nr:UDP-glucosyltransferase 2-like isoform X4 [Adelges cooleyi]
MFLFSVVTVFLEFALLYLNPTQAGLRVLAVHTMAAKSHWNFMNGFLHSLTDAGHNVTVFTWFPEGQRENYTEHVFKGPKRLDMDLVEFKEQLKPPNNLLRHVIHRNRRACDITFSNSKIEAIMTAGNTEHFDVIVAETLVSDCMSQLVRRLRLPLIYLFPSPMPTYLEASFLGEDPNPACVSNFMLSFGYPKTFHQRLLNYLTYKYSRIMLWYFETRAMKSNPRPYDYIEPVVPSLVFANSHFIVEPARPMPPNFIEIGGIHLPEPNTIPDDIREFIENSPNGVIYFTFGSTIKMSSFPDHIKTAFKLALARLPQRILWKYESEMEDKPDNVMTKKWFPQRDILLHPNIKLFIGHGGISGVFEVVDAGVPMLGFPLLYDQPRNIANLVDAGMAISLDVMTVTETQIFESINKLINDKKYSYNAKLASKRFKDRPMSPAKSAAYWTEYIVRHNGAPHLKTKAFDLTWYEYYLLDILSLVLVTMSVIGFILYKCLNVICKIVFFKLKTKTE